MTPFHPEINISLFVPITLDNLLMASLVTPKNYKVLCYAGRLWVHPRATYTKVHFSSARLDV